MPTLLQKNHEISILKGDEKRFTAYINPITMQIYSENFFMSWTERSLGNTEVIPYPFLEKASLFSHFL